jgi:anti-sigma factor (TIGR02949 family)
LPTCRDFLREISEFLDDSLDARTREELEQHVNECPNCFVVLDTTKKTIQVFKGMQPMDVPETVQVRLMRALEQKMAARSQS